MERSGPSLGLTPRLESRPGLRILGYLSLLPAGAVELDAVVDRAVADNPYLERRAWHTCSTCGLATSAERCTACSSSRWATEPEHVMDWRDSLVRDAAVELPAHLGPALAVLVASLDDRGLLPDPPPIDAGDLAAVVGVVRQVGPPGIAATSPIDCVRVQARALRDAGQVPDLVAELADHWLAETAEEAYAAIAASAGAMEAAVREAAHLLRERTRPFVALPGRGPRAEPTDVVFTRLAPDGPLVAHVASPGSAGLAVVEETLMSTPEARAWAAPHREAAQRLLDAVAARSRMLQRVADEVATRQRACIIDGPAHHRPLRRQDVAEALAVHPSTVGRVVSGKVARCPDGRTVPLSSLFGATPTTYASVAAALAALPGATDRELATHLAAAGTPIARRTVAKYRAQVAKQASPSS